jgi:hypothetical protein
MLGPSGEPGGPPIAWFNDPAGSSLTMLQG